MQEYSFTQTRISFQEMGEKGKKILENMTPVTLREALEQVFRIQQPSRRVHAYTGAAGYDLFCEAMEEEMSGKRRIYMSKKPPRFMKSKYRQSATGRYYILVSLAH